MPSVKPQKPRSGVVITIDGPAGAGKSTVAKRLAKELGYAYLDTGAMYRALTVKALRLKVKLDDEQALIKLAEQTTIDFQFLDVCSSKSSKFQKANVEILTTTDDSGKGKVNDQGQPLTVLLDGLDVTEEIRSEEVTKNTFYIARAPGVREIMVNWQRQIGEKNNIVVEGRDTGTVVFPKATRKFYLDADFEERSQRRIKELQGKGLPVNGEELKVELQTRDNKDFSRSVGPLKKADDAILIDSTFLTIDEVVSKILVHLRGVATPRRWRNGFK